MRKVIDKENFTFFYIYKVVVLFCGIKCGNRTLQHFHICMCTVQCSALSLICKPFKVPRNWFPAFLGIDSRTRIFKLLGAQESIRRNRFRQPMKLAGRYNNPIPARFLVPINCSKIPALGFLNVYNSCSVFYSIAQCGMVQLDLEWLSTALYCFSHVLSPFNPLLGETEATNSQQLLYTPTLVLCCEAENVNKKVIKSVILDPVVSVNNSFSSVTESK